MSDEIPLIVMAQGEKIVSRGIVEDEDDPRSAWQVSSPIPGNQIINSWQIYKNIWVVLAKSDAGKYCIFRSINRRKYNLVHEHDVKILNMFWLTDGQMIFSAEDGWWIGKKSGLTWEEISFETAIQAQNMAIIPTDEGEWAFVAYAVDKKIYYCEYPGGDWEVAYDATNVLERFIPAIAGSAIGILAATGKSLIRSVGLGAPGTWIKIQDLEMYITDIIISDRSNTPVFLLTTESEDGSDIQKLFWSYDLGDSLIPEVSRLGSVTAAQSVIPTGENELRSQFVVLARRQPEAATTLRII